MAESTVSPLSAEAFQRLQTTQETHGISRPSLSYWQDAWIRLKSNGRAIASLWIIIGLLAFTLIGPLLWRVDPAAQDVSQISQPPLADRNATIVEPFESWQTDALAPPISGLELAEPATTQSVRLIWAIMPDVDGYRIYRNIYPVTEGAPLGLPLGELLLADQFHFEDRLDLGPETYYYSVVGFNATGEMRETVQAIEVKPETVITIAEAQQRGLIADNATVEVGDNIAQALHPLGTDYLGRDMLARLMQGARVSLFIGIVAPLLFVAFGVLYGSIAGFMGGVTDQVLMRFADFVVALPFLLFMILFKIAFGIGPGESGILPMLIALVLLSWPATARLVRGQILQIREEHYISAAQLLGARTNYLVLRHMIPNTMGVILVTLTFAVPSAIFTEAFLSFIGMGVAPPTPSWGSMSNEGIKTMLSHPHELIFPALLISITVLAFNLLGDGLRDALDARMRSRE